jgi:hypothetical protein
MASNPTVSDLRKVAEVTDDEITAAVDVVIANPKAGSFELTFGRIVNARGFDLGLCRPLLCGSVNWRQIQEVRDY